MLNLFKNSKLYKGVFHNIYYFCPISSYLSVDKHPFTNKKNVFIYHDLNVENLNEVFNTLTEKKERYIEYIENKKNKTKLTKGAYFEDESEEEEEKVELEYSICIIDDMANELKNNDIQKQLNKMLIKSRHLNCAYIFTLQSYYYFPKILRKQITNITIFKTKNTEEWNSIAKELLNLNLDDSLLLYDYIYDKPYTHLDLDTLTNKLYKDFNELILTK